MIGRGEFIKRGLLLIAGSCLGMLLLWGGRLWQSVRRRPPTPADISLLKRRLANFCRRHGIPYLDCAPALGEVASDLPSLYVDDYHLSAKGHRLVSSVLWPFVRQRLGGGR